MTENQKRKESAFPVTTQEIVHFSTGKFEPYIFVSYSHDNAELVMQLIRRLEEEGFCVWVDYNNLRGQHFADEIREGIRECSIFLECLSKSYVEKPYCEKEYLCADSENKNVLAVCLDNIMVKDSPNRFPVGSSAIGYGKGIGENFEYYVQAILEQEVMCSLKDFMNNEKQHLTMKYVFVDQRLTKRLAEHCQNSYKRSGNYCLDVIHKELFPGILDVSRERVYKAENAENVSLYEYIRHRESQKGHVLLKGNGGMGKTVSMLQTCEKLLEDGICAVYVPLHAIDFRRGGSIEKYIEGTICGNDAHILQNLRNCAREAKADREVFLFLDGINELPLGLAGEIVQKQIVEGLFGNYAWAGTRFVLSSRYSLPQSEDIFENVKVLEMLPLESEQIAEYLTLREISFPQSGKVQQLLSNPLMLSLYADAEIYRNLYEKKGKAYQIHLEENPDTPGKIIRNFLQTQLLQMTSVASRDYAIYYVLLEYALPYVAYEMIKQERPLTLKEVREILKMACDPDRNVRFRWLEEDKLEELLWEVETEAEFSRKDVKNLFLYAVEKYRFLYKTGSDDGDEDYVEFLHQDFRDYFAAYHVKNELQALHHSLRRMEDTEKLVLSEDILSNEVVEYCVDILQEENACPWKDEDGWHFPGKKDLEPSVYSMAEQLLARFRQKTDASDKFYYRTINANLLAMMRRGRKNCLVQCDLSELDLRSCYMNGCHFSEYYKEHIYASRFDGAIMDRTFFLGEGHSDVVTAVCPCRKNEVLSGDRSGCVYLWNYEKNILKQLFRFSSQGKVVDLAFFEETGMVGAAYGKQIILYDLVNETILKQKNMKNFQSQYYRKICFDAYGELKYTYDLQPYMWNYLDDTEAEDNIRFSVLTGCAEAFVEENHIQLLYSELYQRVRVLDYEENFELANHGDSRCRNRDFDRKAEPDEKVFRIRYINVRDEVYTKQRIEVIHYNSTGDRFLIVAGKHILEYESKNLTLLRKLHFKKNVHDAAYIQDAGIVAAVGKDLFVLNARWSVTHFLRHEEREHVQIFHSFGDRYYLISSDQVVKELNDRLCVTRMAKGPSCSQFTWVRDKQTDEIQMLFVKPGIIEAGERYSFDTGKVVPAGWCFEMAENPDDFSRRDFGMRDKVEVFDTYDGSKLYTYENHCGIWIFGCSFKNITGTLAESQNIQILEKNGGIVSE